MKDNAVVCTWLTVCCELARVELPNFDLIPVEKSVPGVGIGIVLLLHVRLVRVLPQTGDILRGVTTLEDSIGGGCLLFPLPEEIAAKRLGRLDAGRPASVKNVSK